MQTLSQRLAHARKIHGYSQGDLADAIEVSRGVIANIELERAQPQPIVVNAICRELNINKEWLLFGRDPMEPENERANILDELYQVCATLSEPQQRFLLDTIRAMNAHLIPEQEPAKETGPCPFEDIVRDAESRKGQPKPTRRITEKEI